MILISKKNKRQKSHGDHLATGVNTTVVIRKSKDKDKNKKDFNHIKIFKSPAEALISFNKKSDGSLELCVKYRGFKNLKIKNHYPLSLVRESLDGLDQAWGFIQFNLINNYHQIRI